MSIIEFEGMIPFAFWYFIVCVVAGFAGDYRKFGFWPTLIVSVFCTPVIGLLCAMCSPFAKTEQG